MSRDTIVLISKDAMGNFYLPTYGNPYWKTPNIEELASKGTVFRRHYTAAPSTSMSCLAMFAGIYPYQTNIRDYRPLKEEFKDTLFADLSEKGYDCHILWEASWNDGFVKYSNVWSHTTFDWLEGMEQHVGGKFKHERPILPDKNKVEKAIRGFESKLESILDSGNQKKFIWVHFPHVLAGSCGYGADIELFDQCVGIVRKYVSDDCIYLTADHGNMNGLKGKICYGFDVYEPAIRIPLITPRINGLEEYTGVTSNVDLREIILNSNIVKRDFAISDSAYYAQPERKMAIVGERYKYIYNKQDGSEELYDVLFDVNENINIINMDFWDVDRNIMYPLEEVYWYPYWDESREALEKFRSEKNKIWRESSIQEKIYYKIKNMLKID